MWTLGLKGLTSFTIKNRTNFFGEKKKVKSSFPGVSFYDNTRKKIKLNLGLGLVIKAKALYLHFTL